MHGVGRERGRKEVLCPRIEFGLEICAGTAGGRAGWELGEATQVSPCFPGGTRPPSALVGSWCTQMTPGGSHWGAQGFQARRQLQHRGVSSGERRRHGRLGRLDTEPELARTWCFTLHLWLTLGNHL